ncbi:MAG TPA: hypothetical protein VM261_19945 [Kofleriaceae bacterium]|nr:hypothetical protein [Kofleriaceae bacterium]
MRAAVWAYLVCAFICVVAVFLPAGQMALGPPALAKRESLSLYQVANSQDTVQSILKKYRGSASRVVGGVVLGKVSPHLKGRAASGASDVRDAMDALDSLKDEDVKTVGTIATATMWALIALQIIAALLLFGVATVTSRVRVIAALLAAALSAAIGVAILLVLQRVVLEANKEIELEMFSLRIGAYLIPLAACAGLAAAIAVLVLQTRERRAWARGPQPGGPQAQPLQPPQPPRTL